MSFRPFCVLAIALLFACRGSERVAPVAASEPARDIILITIDTWRADAAGFAGNARVKTPFLDGLARRGVVFSNAHAHNVVTLPSHTNILTGLNPYEHGVRENAGYVLDDKVDTLAERLRAAGYTTGAFVAAFPLDARFNLDQGFDHYDDNYGKGSITSTFALQERGADAVLDSAARWWREREGQKRFAWIHLFDPHAPYTPKAPFDAEYRDRPYLGEVAAVDDALARQLGPLITGNTMVVITADHGEALGDHGELTHGLFAYESTLKVPLVVVAPGLTSRTEKAFVRHIDIAPTILAAARVEAALPGQSLLGSVKQSDTYFESLSTSLNRGWAPLTGLIQGDLKFIDLPLSELYDLEKDPAELKNLVSDQRRAATAARTALRAVQVDPGEGRSVSSEEAARLRSLGYFTGSASAQFTEADDPKNLVHVDAMLHQIIEHQQRGDAEEALRIAREVVRLQPKMAAGQELLAFVLQQSERIPESIAALETLVRSGQASASSKTQLSKLLTETGRASEALALIAPIAAASSDPEVFNAYGIALSEAGRPADAATQFQRAIAVDPNNAPAWQNLGIAALRIGDARSAEQHLNRALQLNPALPLALNSLGVVYAQRGDMNRAQQMWRQAFANDRRQYDALYNLALVALRNGDRDEARRAFTEFVEIAPPARYARDIAAARDALRRIQ
ncbi:MAG TPA: sulfatase-like hydrolase/transferase [Thermoanaerobaculia bacterium]|nr:sulfatase-like hydrolase/transferase [Thermoanaerobaculia bacterium]